MNRYKAIEYTKIAFPTVPWAENKFVNVKGDKSPFDGDLLYWAKRNSKYYFGLTTELLRRQEFKCGRCNLMLLGGQKAHLHHIDGNHSNWEIKNLTALHEACHDDEHHISKAINA